MLNPGATIKICLVSWTAFMPSRWQTVLSIRKQYNVDFRVVAPPCAKITPVYDPSGYLSLGSVGLKECPFFVTLIPLNDVERPDAGFQAKALKYFLKSYKPNIIWIHGEPLQQVTRQICQLYLFSQGPKIYQAAVDNYQPRGKGPNALLNGLLLKQVTAFLAVSQSTALALKEELGIPEQKIVVTYLPNLPIKKVTLKNNRGFRIGFAGRIAPQKGIGILLDALDLLPSEIQLFTAGDGEEEIVRHLQAHPRIHHMGMLSDLSALFSQIDLLIVPSLTTPKWKEQFGRVIAEAFSVGIPVVGSDSGSIPDVVGEAGLIYPEHSSKALSERIMALSLNQSFYQELANKATARFKKHFSVAAHAQRLATIFNLDIKQ